MTTVRSLPGSGLATARISNARLSPSLRIAVGQMVGRTVAPMPWSSVNTALNVCATGSAGSDRTSSSSAAPTLAALDGLFDKLGGAQMPEHETGVAHAVFLK